jgi:hypothetical protein
VRRDSELRNRSHTSLRVPLCRVQTPKSCGVAILEACFELFFQEGPPGGGQNSCRSHTLYFPPYNSPQYNADIGGGRSDVLLINTSKEIFSSCVWRYLEGSHRQGATRILTAPAVGYGLKVNTAGSYRNFGLGAAENFPASLDWDSTVAASVPQPSSHLI